MLQVFDMADPNLIVGKRDVTTVPTQALFLMNNPFVLKQSEQMAKRVWPQRTSTRPRASTWPIGWRWAGCRPNRERSDIDRLPRRTTARSLEAANTKGNQQLGRLDQLLPDAVCIAVNSATCIDM